MILRLGSSRQIGRVDLTDGAIVKVGNDSRRSRKSNLWDKRRDASLGFVLWMEDSPEGAVGVLAFGDGVHVRFVQGEEGEEDSVALEQAPL